MQSRPLHKCYAALIRNLLDSMSQRDRVLQAIEEVVVAEIDRQSMLGWTPILFLPILF